MKRQGAVLIGNAIVWGVVMIACASALKGTGAFQDIQLILTGGAGFSLLVVFAGLRRKSPE